MHTPLLPPPLRWSAVRIMRAARPFTSQEISVLTAVAIAQARLRGSQNSSRTVTDKASSNLMSFGVPVPERCA